MTTPEQLARQQIDALLGVAGWSVQDYTAYQPGATRGIALREVPLASGRCDYLLLVDRQPLRPASRFRGTGARHRAFGRWALIVLK